VGVGNGGEQNRSAIASRTLLARRVPGPSSDILSSSEKYPAKPEVVPPSGNEGPSAETRIRSA